MLSQLSRALLSLLVLSLLTACTTPLEAVTDYDDKFDFSAVRNIAFQPVDRSASSVRISDMQIDRVSGALADELRERGFNVVEDTSQADLLLAWHLVAEQKTDVRTFNSMSYYNCWRCGPNVSDVSVRQYTQGTFIVDLISPERKRSVWRSVIQSQMKAKPNPDKAEQRRRQAAEATFAQFPPS